MKDVPALSELIGEFEPSMFNEKQEPIDGILKWKRPYTKDGQMSETIIISTEAATALFDISAQTLTNWAKNHTNLRIAYGWWSIDSLLRAAIDVNRFDMRKNRN
jgi:hypothetical protein